MAVHRVRESGLPVRVKRLVRDLVGILMVMVMEDFFVFNKNRFFEGFKIKEVVLDTLCSCSLSSTLNTSTVDK